LPRSLRLPVVLVTAVIIAEAAVLLLRPREERPEPLKVEPRAYFSDQQIERGEDFRSGQLVLYGVRTAIELGVLWLIVARPPGVLRRVPRRPVLAGAAAAAALSLTVTAVGLPVRAIARERAKDVGLVTQSWTGWLGDVVKSEAIGIVVAGAGGMLLVVALRRFGRRWWVPGAVAVVAFGAVITYVAPVVLEPLFNTFKPLPPGDLRQDVLRLARQAGVDVGEVYEVDASRRTTAANAYVAGLGNTKRVVLYDNLLRDFKPAEVRLIVAHELGHVHYRDVPHGLLYLAIVAPFGMLAVARLAERVRPRGTPEDPGPAWVPAVALSVAIMVPVITTVSNQLSRAVELRADRYSLGLTHDPETLIQMQRRLVIQNVSDPDPPRAVTFLLGTHPPAVERIGLAEAYRRRQ
jgi:STE24 endopeptidase